MNHLDLFGGETPMQEKRRGAYQEKRLNMAYRKTEGKENCGNCKKSYMRPGVAGYYRKCKEVGNSRSTATDVSNKCVCNLWEKVKLS